MRVVRDRAEARWLPSRRRFGLFRLWAYARLRSAAPEPEPGLMLMVDPDQCAVESYTASAWLALTTTGFIAAALSKHWPLAAAIAAAIPLACMALHIPLVVAPLILRSHGTRNAAINSVAILGIHVAVAAYLVRDETWARFVAWQFLAVLGLNAIAAAIVFLLRGRIASLEAGYGVTPSSAS